MNDEQEDQDVRVALWEKFHKASWLEMDARLQDINRAIWEEAFKSWESDPPAEENRE